MLQCWVLVQHFFLLPRIEHITQCLQAMNASLGCSLVHKIHFQQTIMSWVNVKVPNPSTSQFIRIELITLCSKAMLIYLKAYKQIPIPQAKCTDKGYNYIWPTSVNPCARVFIRIESNNMMSQGYDHWGWLLFYCISSYSASRDNWCRMGGDEGCRVGEVLPPRPTIRVLSYSN